MDTGTLLAWSMHSFCLRALSEGEGATEIQPHLSTQQEHGQTNHVRLR